MKTILTFCLLAFGLFGYGQIIQGVDYSMTSSQYILIEATFVTDFVPGEIVVTFPENPEISGSTNYVFQSGQSLFVMGTGILEEGQGYNFNLAYVFEGNTLETYGGVVTIPAPQNAQVEFWHEAGFNNFCINWEATFPITSVVSTKILGPNGMQVFKDFSSYTFNPETSWNQYNYCVSANLGSDMEPGDLFIVQMVVSSLDGVATYEHEFVLPTPEYVDPDYEPTIVTDSEASWNNLSLDVLIAGSNQYDTYYKVKIIPDDMGPTLWDMVPTVLHPGEVFQTEIFLSSGVTEYSGDPYEILPDRNYGVVRWTCSPEMTTTDTLWVTTYPMPVLSAQVSISEQEILWAIDGLGEYGILLVSIFDEQADACLEEIYELSAGTEELVQVLDCDPGYYVLWALLSTPNLGSVEIFEPIEILATVVPEPEKGEVLVGVETLGEIPILVYPNPANDSVVCSGDWTVYDQIGREIARVKNSFSVATWPAGVYTLKNVVSGVTEKLLVVH